MNDAYNIKDKMYGCLYGHAIGDALGLISEFLSKPEIELRYPEGISAYLNNKGIWEDDDTNQMLCILDELIENRGIIPKDLAGRLNVNEGGDADTNAAVACAILGAKYGYNSIPEYYITNLYNEDIYRTKVNKFISIAVKENNR